jgi:hypothetical protein
MRAGFDATRRSRDIGAKKQGHGGDNRLVIPAPCHSERPWTEQLGPHRQEPRLVRGRDILFLVEETSGGCIHACSVADVSHVLANTPTADWSGLKTVVLRQSTRKQRLLRPAWGRLYYSAELGLPGQSAIRTGPVLVLEAIDCGADLEWPLSLSPRDRAELDRLRADGHHVRQERRCHRVSMTPDSVRATQLYRTVPHEIGHWVDFVEQVLTPAASGADTRGSLSEAYFARPYEEREAYAHQYAEARKAHLMKFGVIPFERV